jgi:hypothetical protein
VVEALKKRLNSWNSRHLSFGGRVTLINSVLASLPLYYFSFYKAPSCVIQSLVKIQCTFLWAGGSAVKKICWVKWDQICLPKGRGGLGVKNLELFNLALLSKWKWRCLSDGEAVWDDLLRFRYGHLPSTLMVGQPLPSTPRQSLWWRDIMAP